MEREVFKSSEFAAYAKKSLVLMVADFPKGKPQPEALKKANEALAKAHNLEYFPTLILLNSDGKKLGQVAYEGDTPKAFIAKVAKYQGK